MVAFHGWAGYPWTSTAGAALRVALPGTVPRNDGSRRESRRVRGLRPPCCRPVPPLPMAPSRVRSGAAHLFDDPRAALPHGRHSTAASGRQTAHSVAPSGAEVGIRTVVVKCCATRRRRVAGASRTRWRRVRYRAPQARRPCPTHPSGDTSRKTMTTNRDHESTISMDAAFGGTCQSVSKSPCNRHPVAW